MFDVVQPVAGAQLTINSLVTATTNANGTSCRGRAGSSVVEGDRAHQPSARDRDGGDSRPGSFAIVNLVLVPAAIRGSVKTVAGGVGAAVKVDLYASSAPSALLAFAFTDDASQYEFPVVTQAATSDCDRTRRPSRPLDGHDPRDRR